MKRIFTVLSVVAIANLLGLAVAAAWLAATQRIDRERLETIRAILHEPVPAERARLAKEQDQVGSQSQAPEAPLPESPPVPAAMLVDLGQDLRRADEFRAQRLEREAQDLARTMTLERQRLDRDRAAFEKERAQFEQMRSRIAAMEGEQQFKDALSVLRQVKPVEAKAMLQQIIDGIAPGIATGGSTAELGGMDRAVAYLDALGSMERGEIMSQFVKDSPEVAAELLERLRTFGLVAGPSGDSSS